MIEPRGYVAWNPAGVGLLCAMFYVDRGDDVFGWYQGAAGGRFPAAFFALQDYYSSRGVSLFRSVDDDVHGQWVAETPQGARRIDPPAPVPEELCHDLARMQDAFVRQWLFYAADAEAAEVAEYRRRGWAVHPVNVRAERIGRLTGGPGVEAWTAPGFDLNVLTHLSRRWRLDHRPA